MPAKWSLIIILDICYNQKIIAVAGKSAMSQYVEFF